MFYGLQKISSTSGVERNPIIVKASDFLKNMNEGIDLKKMDNEENDSEEGNEEDDVEVEERQVEDTKADVNAAHVGEDTKDEKDEDVHGKIASKYKNKYKNN